MFTRSQAMSRSAFSLYLLPMASPVSGIWEEIFRFHKFRTSSGKLPNGSRLGPEIFAAGPILEGDHPFWPFSISVKDERGARRAVDTLIQEKADFLKVYNTLSRQTYLAIASAAKENRVAFVGHIPDSMTPAEA